MRCVASVVWSATGEPLGGLSVSALAERLTVSDMPAMGERVRDLALELTHVMGGRVPPANGAR